jgi:hypothetical protein
MNQAMLSALAFLLIAGPALAQNDTAGKPARVLSHTFVTPSREFVRVRLLSEESYRVQVSRAQVRLEVRAVSQGVQPPQVREIFHGEKLTVILLEPRVSAEYEIRILGAGSRPVVLTIDRRPVKR